MPYKDLEKRREYKRKYRQRPKVKARRRKYYQTPEGKKQHRESMRKYFQNPKSKKWRKDYYKRYYQTSNGKKVVRKAKAKYYQKNKNKIKEYLKKYYQTPEGKATLFRGCCKRREKFPIVISPKDIQLIIRRDKGRCVYCSVILNDIPYHPNQLTFDHINPSKPTILNNLVLCCWKCNNSKRARNVFDWCREKNIEVPDVIKQLSKDRMIPLNRFVTNQSILSAKSSISFGDSST